MLEGLLITLQPMGLTLLALGTLLGIIVGCLPGLTATMALALLVPFTFAMSPELGLVMLAGLFVASAYADAIPACLINTPGTAAAMATTFVGYPMTQKGQGQRALIGACFASFIGAFPGALVMLGLAPTLAAFSLRFGAPEFFWLGVFALTIIGAVSAKSLLKGLAGGGIGLLVSTAGAGVTGGTARYTFGSPEMLGGISTVAALIGVFALRQVLVMVEERLQEIQVTQYETKRGETLKTIWDILRHQPANLIRSSGIGTFIGILPGAGPPIAALVSYNEASRWSKNRHNFGKGELEGVTASEVANNAGATAAMIPLLTLGVPGSAAAAVIMGSLFAHGLTPGAGLYETDPQVPYAFTFALILAGFFTFVFGSILSKYLVRVISLPSHYLIPAILVMCTVGSFAVRNNIVDLIGMIVLGVAAYLLHKVGIGPAPIALGIILGPIVENAFVTSLAMSRATSIWNVFFTRPLSILFIILTVISAIWPFISDRVLGSQTKEAVRAGDT
jgi:putative tricarboxylic transport membrane protein